MLKRLISALVLTALMATPLFAKEEYTDMVLQSAAVALGDGQALPVDRYTSVGVDVTVETTATVTFEGSVAGGAWSSVTCASSGSTSASLVTTASATGLYQCNVAGLKAFRARVSAWTAGAVTVFARATTAIATKGGGGGGGGGAGSEYDEDSGHVSGSPGMFPLTVRSDAGGALCGADGDYCPFQTDSNGAVRVTGGGGGTEYNTNDPAPTNPVGTSTLVERTDALGSPGTEAAGDWTNLRGNAFGALWTIDANSAANTTSLALIDDAIFAEDAAHVSSDKGIPALCVRHDTATTGMGADGDYTNCGISAAGRIYVDALISDGAGAVNTIVDSGTLTAVTTITNPVTVTDGAGALNVIVDSGTLTAVTSITNAVTVTDGAGALNTIVDSGTLTAVTTITNPVTVTDGAGALNVIVDSGSITVTDGAGALNVIVDSGTITTVSTVSSVSAIIAGTGATNLGKAIDSVQGATDTGVAALVVRDDVLTTLTPADGDYTTLRVSSTGALHVTGGGGGTQYNIGDALTTTATGTVSLAIRDDALTTLADADGDAVALRVDSIGSLHVTIDSIATAAASATVTEDGDIPANATGVTEVAAVNYCYNGTTPVHCAYTTASGLAVDVKAVVPGTGATNLGKAEDAAHTSGDVGVMSFGVRNDAGTTLCTTTGDYCPLSMDSNGAIRVTGAGGGTQYNIDDVAGATNTGTVSLVKRKDTLASLTPADGDWTSLQVNSQGALHVTGGGGGTEYVVNAVAPADPTGSTFVMERDDVITTLSEIEGDWTNPRSTSEGALWTQDFNSDAILAYLATLAGAVGGTEMQVDVLTMPTVTITDGAGALNVIVDSGSITVTDGAGALNVIVDSGTITAVTTITNPVTVTDGAGALNVIVDSLPTVTVTDGAGALNTIVDSGTITTVSTVTAVTTITNAVAVNGSVAHDGVDSGAPVKVGAKAVAFGSNPTGVAAADRTDLYANRAGIPFVLGGHPNSITTSAQIQDADNAQTDQAIVSVAGGSKIVVTRLTASCDGSTTNPTNIKVGFATATLAASAHTGVASILHEFDGVPAGGGFTIGNGGGVLGVGADGEDLRYTIEDPVGGNCSITVSYFTIES